MRQCPECGTAMVLWERGRPGNPAWRCPACSRIRRKDYHAKVEIDETRAPHAGSTTQLYIDDSDFKLYMGDCLDVLHTLPDNTVDCVVTSPPYWGLRDYNASGQLGMEATPELFVQNMVDVFREVRRVLAPHGTCWLNLGDSYTSGGRDWRAPDAKDAAGNPRALDTRPDTPMGLKPKDLVGIPWRTAFALQADGWYLRMDVIWGKLNPMPESVTDRPTKSHEYIFMLTKSPHYWFDQEAVRESAEWARWGNQTVPKYKGTDTATGWMQDGTKEELQARAAAGRNIRSVWSIATQPYPGAHFATFPEELARRAIFAGCAIRVCRECGKPSERIVERDRENVEGWAPVKKLDHSQNAADQGNGRFGDPITETVGWTDCGHNTWRPGVVLDPFMGSGTVAKVARDHQRHSVGIELNPDYCDLIAKRLQQLSLLT